MVSLARTLDRIATQNGTPTGDYFFDRLPANPKLLNADPNEPPPHIVGPWNNDTAAEARLRWYWSQSGGDLGEKSAQEALVFRIASGGGGGGGGFELIAGEVTSRTPDEWRLHAAARARQIRSELAQLEQTAYAVLEMCFSLRRPDPQVKALLRGEDEKLEPVVTYMVRTGRVDLRAALKDGLPQVLESAAKLRADAIGAYSVAAGLARAAQAPGGTGKRQQPGRGRKPRAVGMLTPVGPRGGSSRRFRAVEPA
jgi:hypothetical protein